MITYHFSDVHPPTKGGSPTRGKCNTDKDIVISGFFKSWAVEKCTEPAFKMFWKSRNEQNKSRYTLYKSKYERKYMPLPSCYLLSDSFYLKLAITCKNMFPLARYCTSRNFYSLNLRMDESKCMK